MKHKDHKLLARHLMHLTPHFWRNANRRRAFLTGSILPDYNPFTYMRDIRKSRRMAGHDHPHSMRQIEKIMLRLQKHGVHSLRDCYALGALIHYLADSFTYPHTEAFRSSMAEHNRYEQALHGVFPLCVRSVQRRSYAPVSDLLGFLRQKRMLYHASPHSMYQDAYNILEISSVSYVSIFQENIKKSPFTNKSG